MYIVLSLIISSITFSPTLVYGDGGDGDADGAGDHLVFWKNDQVEAIRSADPGLGKTLIIGARHREEYQRSGCSFRTPPYQEHVTTYEIIDGVVYDDNNEVVDGIKAWDDSGGASVCGLKIISMEESHDESVDPAASGWSGVIHRRDIITSA